MRPQYPAGLRALVLPLVLLATSCVGGDAPTDPSRVVFSPPAQLAVQPRLATTSGQALSAAAAQEAFDRLTCFELTAVRIADGEIAAEETFRVEPGEDEYELSVEVDLEQSPESFQVTITAYASSGGNACGFELFSGTSEVSVEAEGLSDGGDAPTPSTLTLSPSGPQAEASELQLEPGHAVLSGGGTVQVAPTLLDDAGGVIQAGEELAEVLTWTSSSSGTADVDASGSITGGSDGTAEVTATTVTGLSATVPVYVANGEFAYVTGGSLVRTTVDGSDSEALATGASRPAWRPDGSGLAYESGGSIREVEGGVLLSGAGSPTFSPDGAYLTGSGGEGLVHATFDGAFQADVAVPGPANPQWLSATTLVGDGGSIVRVRADGTESTELTTAASDRLPAVGGGLIAFVSDRGPGGTGVWVVEAGSGEPNRITPESFEAGGRPSLRSGWILIPGSGDQGSGLHLVPADGSGAPLPLSIAAGSDPAWKPAGGGSPPALQIDGIHPERPRAGDEITVLGSGFSWVVEEANTVEVPVLSGEGSATVAGLASEADGSADAEIVEVTESSLTFLAPDNLAAGTATVSTPFSETDFELEPASGDLRVVAETSSGKAVEGVEVEIPDGSGGVLDSGTTGSDGTLLLEDLPTGDHSLSVAAPEGFSVQEPSEPASIALDETTEVTLDATALPWSLDVSRSSVTFEEPDLTERIDYEVADIDGDPMDAALDFTRVPGSVVQARTRDGQIELESLNPGEATVTVRASAPAESSAATASGPAAASVHEASPSATIEVVVLEPAVPPGSLVGNVHDASTGAGISGATVEVRDSESGSLEASVTTDSEGGYEATDLPEGDYRIVASAENFEPGSASATVVGGETTTVSPIGLISEAGVGDLIGVVRDATSSDFDPVLISGATVELREGSGAPDTDPVLFSTETDASGEFSIIEFPAGNYTLRAIAEGFSDGHADVVIENESTSSREVLLSPELNEGEIRIVLTWGPNLTEVASDLDSHLTGPHDGLQAVNSTYHVDDVDGGRFHTAYYVRGDLDALPWAHLHNDDTFYEGPETTTITRVLQGTYRFSVDLFCCTETLRTSQATVQVYDSNGLVAEFNAPNQDGQTWVVFDIVNGSVVPVNQMHLDRNRDFPEHELAHPGGLQQAAPAAPSFEMAPEMGGEESEPRESRTPKEIRPVEFDGDLRQLRQRIEREDLPYVIPSGAEDDLGRPR